MQFKEYYKNRKLMEQDDAIPQDSVDTPERDDHGSNFEKLNNFLSCILSTYDNVQKVIAKMQELGFVDKTGRAQEMMASIDWDGLHREAKNFISNTGKAKKKDTADVVKPSAADTGSSETNEMS